MSAYQSWGRYPRVEQDARPLSWRHQPLPLAGLDGPVLAYGQGRSYGDACLNAGGVLLPTRRLDHFIAFDAQEGLLRAEAGATLAEVLAFCLPRGFFLPVTPGTRYVTLGGAVANDVHGKNHHRQGTFGRHVTRLELLRSDGARLVCSPQENSALFAATIGGLGLTGLITWIELRLMPVVNPGLAVENLRFGGLDEFFALSQESDAGFDYTVAWVDCLAKGADRGRGIFMRANHLDTPPRKSPQPPRRGLVIPCQLPGWFLNPWSLKAFNAIYYHWPRRERVSQVLDPLGFFYPLDALDNWNLIYGPQGLVQFQCVLPMADAATVLDEMLTLTARSGMASFLAVLKVFGDITSPGLLSFPRPGATLALDFPIRGRQTWDLMAELTRLVRQAEGSMYPAKDACMSPEDFAAFYPNHRELETWRDPRFSSSFWRRVAGQEGQ